MQSTAEQEECVCDISCLAKILFEYVMNEAGDETDVKCCVRMLVNKLNEFQATL